MSDLDLQPEDSLGGEMNEMPPFGNDNEDLPPMDDNDNDKLENGDGTEEDNDEGIEIYNSLPIEKKSAAIKYMKSMQDDDSETDDKNQMESKMSIDHLVNEITNGIISDFDMNDRIGEKGIKRNEKKIANKKLNLKNPFISGR